MKLGAIVLAGGTSSRMGRSKAWLEIEGVTFLERAVRTARAFAGESVVVAGVDRDLPPIEPPPILARDENAGRGPLEGIAAGFEALGDRADVVAVVPVDLPFLHPVFVQRLIELRGDFDIAVPAERGRPVPLPFVASRVAIEHVRAMLAADRLKVGALFERAKTRFCERAELLASADLAAVDPELLSLENVNTPAEYERALARTR